MPALGGIAPPAGTRLLNMDIPGARGARPAAYELSSPIAPAAFEHLYTASAVRAGYRVSAGKGRVVGVRGDGAGFRLLLSASGGATAGVLTIKPASTRRA